MPPWSSYSASIVCVAERSAPLCWRTPYSTVLAVTSSASGVEWLSSGWSRATYAMLESRPRVMET